MSWSTGKWIRKIGLVAMIAFDVGAMWWAYWEANITGAIWPWIWFWFIVALNVVVIAGEILAVVLTGKTLSTNFKYWAQKRGWKAYVFLGFFIMAILSLAVHLIPTG